jgi:hypothetical protein
MAKVARMGCMITLREYYARWLSAATFQSTTPDAKDSAHPSHAREIKYLADRVYSQLGLFEFDPRRSRRDSSIIRELYQGRTLVLETSAEIRAAHEHCEFAVDPTTHRVIAVGSSWAVQKHRVPVGAVVVASDVGDIRVESLTNERHYRIHQKIHGATDAPQPSDLSAGVSVAVKPKYECGKVTKLLRDSEDEEVVKAEVLMDNGTSQEVAITQLLPVLKFGDVFTAVSADDTKMQILFHHDSFNTTTLRTTHVVDFHSVMGTTEARKLSGVERATLALGTGANKAVGEMGEGFVDAVFHRLNTNKRPKAAGGTASPAKAAKGEFAFRALEVDYQALERLVVARGEALRSSAAILQQALVELATASPRQIPVASGAAVSGPPPTTAPTLTTEMQASYDGHRAQRDLHMQQILKSKEAQASVAGWINQLSQQRSGVAESDREGVILLRSRFRAIGKMVVLLEKQQTAAEKKMSSIIRSSAAAAAAAAPTITGGGGEEEEEEEEEEDEEDDRAGEDDDDGDAGVRGEDDEEEEEEEKEDSDEEEENRIFERIGADEGLDELLLEE